MSFIEGVGDEVTIVGLLVCLLMLIVTILSARFFTSDSYTWIEFWNEYIVPLLAENDNIEAAAARNESHSPEVETTPNIGTNESNRRTVDVNSDEVSNQADAGENTESTEPDIEDGAFREAQEDIVSDVNCDASEDIEKDLKEASEGSDPVVENERDEQRQDTEEIIPSNRIRVRLKFLNDTERLVTACRIDTILDFKRANFSEDLAANRTVRLIYNGQLLQNDATLESYGIEDRTVVHVHVSQAQAAPTHSTATNPDLDISSLMWPLFSIVLGICWIMYIRYPEIYNVTSVVLLIAFTATFVIVYIHLQVQIH